MDSKSNETGGCKNPDEGNSAENPDKGNSAVGGKNKDFNALFQKIEKEEKEKYRREKAAMDANARLKEWQKICDKRKEAK